MKIRNFKGLFFLAFLFGLMTSCQENDKSYTIAYGSKKAKDSVLVDTDGTSKIKLIGRDGGYLAWSPKRKTIRFLCKI